MLMMMGIFYYLWRNIQGLTGLKLEEVIHDPDKDNTA